jgi:transcriptional regulator with XRE-family HTH domain
MKKFPFPRTSVAEFIADKLASTDKTQKEIAQECGFEHPNVISMFKTGMTKLPINRISALANAIDADPVYLLRLVMLEYMPDTWGAVEDIMQSTLLTANELALVRAFRDVTADSDAVATVIDRDAVLAIVLA